MNVTEQDKKEPTREFYDPFPRYEKLSSSASISIVRICIVLYTIFYITIVLWPWSEATYMGPFAEYSFILEAVYYFLFPLMTMVTSIYGTDKLYIVYLFLLVIDVNFISEMMSLYHFTNMKEDHRNWYLFSVHVSHALVFISHIVFFIWWAIPNRLFFLNTFQIGLECEPNLSKFKVLTRFGWLWLSTFCMTVAFSIFTIEPVVGIPGNKFYYVAAYILRFGFILLIEFFMYSNTHPLVTKSTFSITNLASNFASLFYAFMMAACFTAFLILFALSIAVYSGAMEDLVDGELWNELMQHIACVFHFGFTMRFMFLWDISVNDILKRIPSNKNYKNDYPQYSWDFHP